MVDIKSTALNRKQDVLPAVAPTHMRVMVSDKDLRPGTVRVVALANGRRTSPRPETRRQAETWDRNKRHYVQLGLCSSCAAQAAWGHQLGFTEVIAPCSRCLHVVIGFPVNEPGEWRSSSPRRGAPMSAGFASTRPSLPIL